jgi:hypothetical protein
VLASPADNVTTGQGFYITQGYCNMARPKKIGLDYFPVDVDFDTKVQSIELLHKNDGLVWVIKFWQLAYKNEFGEVDFTGLFGELFANNCRITTEQHENILKTALAIQFCYKTDSGFYTSNGIKKRISTVSKERCDAIERKEKKSKNKSKGKESKVKDCPDCSPNNWRTTFEIYRQIVLDAMEYLINDKNEYEKLQKFNPTLDIKLSIEKSVENFWGTEAGWSNKKKSKTENIDMVMTLKNNLDKNKVYLSKGQQQNGYAGNTSVRAIASEYDGI